MKTNKRWLGLVILITMSCTVNGQYTEKDSRYFVGNTLALLGNFAQTNAPDFALRRI